MKDEELRGLAQEAVMALSSCWKTRQLYSRGHKQLDEAFRRLSAVLEKIFSSRKEFTLGFIKKEIVFEKLPLYSVGEMLGALKERLRELGIEKITFLKGAGEGEIARLTELLASEAAKAEPEDFEALVAKFGIRDIEISKIFVPEKGPVPEDHDSEAKRMYDNGFRLLDKITQELNEGRTVNLDGPIEFVERLVYLLKAGRKSLLTSFSIKRHDVYTFVHVLNVSVLNLVQADGLGIKEKGLATAIGMAGLMHDVGKIKVSAEILRKKGKLDREDVDAIRTHPLEGAKMLVKQAGEERLASVVAFEHHVRYDRTGYPRPLGEKEPCLASMLTSMSDMYDAMRGRRVYRAGAQPERIYGEMTKLKGASFEPTLLDHFFRMIGVYPVGTLVKLVSGESAIVVREGGEDIWRPTVQLLTDTSGRKLAGPEKIIDLSLKDASTGAYAYSILESMDWAENPEILPEAFK